jgi:NADPH:quinone reductase-like Zn-dependent oxidoreductase
MKCSFTRTIRRSIRSNINGSTRFLGSDPPVILGFDLAGIVVAVGDAVTKLSVGDEVMAMANSNKDGGRAAGGDGGYAVARDYLTIAKSSSLSFAEAAVLNPSLNKD